MSCHLSFSTRTRFRKRWNRFHWIWHPVRFIGSYALWILIIRLLALTFITYFTISPTSHFQDINEVFSSNEVSLMALSAFLFVGLLIGLNPLTSTTLEEMITPEQIEKGFLRGFLQGALLGGCLIVVFLLCGFYRYLGYFIQFQEAPLELGNVLLRMVTLITLTYCEEFIFHYKLIKQLQGSLPTLVIAHGTAILYCGIKILQFDLGILQLISLYLLSLSLFYRYQQKQSFTHGAGFWAALLIIFQPLLSLPVFGNDFSGIFLIKYQPDPSRNWIRLLCGGSGGPLSSILFQFILTLDITRSLFKQRPSKQNREYHV